MTTEELARAKRRNRRLLICAAVCLGMIFAWAFLAQPGLLDTAQASEPVNPYEAEIIKLRAEVNLLKRDNERLREELDEAKKDKSAVAPTDAQGPSTPQPAAERPTPSSAPAEPPKEETYMYLGKQISNQQFRALYAEFSRTMIYIDGKMLDKGEGMAWEKYRPKTSSSGAPGWELKSNRVSPISSQPPLIGSVREPYGTVTKVTPDGIIVYKEGRAPSSGFGAGGAGGLGWDPVEYRIRGVDISKYAEGSSVASIAQVIYVGTCKVAGNTIQDYVLSAPKPTEVQFADALAKGLQLYRWNIQQKPNPLFPKGQGSANSHIPKTAPEAVATPVK